jgi:hypothetical protein
VDLRVPAGQVTAGDAVGQARADRDHPRNPSGRGTLQHRIETIQGSLEATAGQISHALLGLLKEKFLCTVALDAAQLNNKEQRQQIDKLGCRYQLNSAGIAISGMYTWGNTGKGCVIMAADKPLVSIPAMSTLPVAQLVQLVSPHDPYWVPANREATDMAEKLPLPAADTKQQ